MANLLSANLLRLRKSKLFWGILVFVAVFALWQIYDCASLGINTIDTAIFGYAGAVGITEAVWSGFFLGTDYSDGTLRNKLATGCPRKTVYLANLVTNIIAAVLQCAVYLVVLFGLGSLLVGPPAMEAGRLLLLLVGSLLTMTALCAIYTLLGMLCSQKTAAAVVCIAGSLILYSGMSTIDSDLDIPEYRIETAYSESGEAVEEFRIPRPEYVGGTKRVIYQTLDDLLPFGQTIQYMRSRGRNIDPLPLMAYSLGVSTAATAAGLALFRKKDLK